MQLSFVVPTPLQYFSSLVQSGDSLPILETAASIAQDEYPDLDMQSVLGEVDELLARLKRRIAPDAPPLQTLRLLNQYFFRELSFGGNVNHYDDPGNSYIHRVLKTGGHFLCLEFSSVDVPALDRLYELYSFNVIPAVGRAVTGDAEAYRYLVESIRKFPKPAAFAKMMQAAGLRRVSFEPMTGGVVAMHSGWRL